MANEYTPNYNLDLYTDNDKPNLRDQYNGAITKIDTQLHEFSNNMVIITDSANQAREKAATAQAAAEANTKSITTLNTTVTEMDSAYKTADERLSNDITGAYKAADTEIVNGYKAADTKLSKDITDAYKAAINSHFPIKSGDIQAGAITRDKLDAQALESLIKGTVIRHFDNKDSNADNEGLVVPKGDCQLAGYYLPELTMLVITKFEVDYNTIVKDPIGNETTQFRLPSYVPHTTAKIVKTGSILIEYTSSNNFHNWSGLAFNNNGYVGPNTEIGSNIAASLAAPAIEFLRAYGVA